MSGVLVTDLLDDFCVKKTCSDADGPSFQELGMFGGVFWQISMKAKVHADSCFSHHLAQDNSGTPYVVFGGGSPFYIACTGP